MKARDIKTALAAFKAVGQPVMLEALPCGTVRFVPVVPATPDANGPDLVLEALSRAS